MAHLGQQQTEKPSQIGQCINVGLWVTYTTNWNHQQCTKELVQMQSSEHKLEFFQSCSTNASSLEFHFALRNLRCFAACEPIEPSNYIRVSNHQMVAEYRL